MSTTLEVGLLDEERWGREYRDDFTRLLKSLRQALRDAGAPDYQEPTFSRCWSIPLWPSNGLAFVQRLAAYFPDPDDVQEWPTPGDPATMPNPLDDDEVKDSYALDQEGPFQHLIFHHPRSGFWVPVDFADVIMPDESFGVGNLVGSSVRLLAECERLARLLDLPLLMGPDDKRLRLVAERPGVGPSGWTRYGVEAYNLVRLYAACRESLERGAAIYVCR